MKLVCISDTHNCHEKIVIPEGDILIHTGDATNDGTVEEIEKFANWFKKLPHRVKIFVAGNHDRLFEENPQLARSILGNSIVYLQDSSVEIGGIKFYGSPWQPRYFDWAFCLSRGSDELEEKWSLIPEETEVLLTHSPPYGILDEAFQTNGTSHEGCEKLRERIEKLAFRKLRLHIFGHIHSGYGVAELFGVRFVNASICDEDGMATNQPIVLDFMP